MTARQGLPNRVLIISYFFPPHDCTASVEALKFAAHLEQLGWSATVVAARSEYPETLSTGTFEGTVYRTPQLDVNWPIKKLAGAERTKSTGYVTDASSTKGRLMGRAGRLYRQLVNFPDGQIGWYPFGVRAAREAAGKDRPTVILSSAFPVTNHLVARRVAKQLNLPWVADFRDLWTDNHHFRRREPLMTLEKKLERRVMHDADYITTPSDGWSSLLETKLGVRTGTVPNAFDPADYPKTDRDRSRFTLTYTGVLYPETQDPSSLLRALAELKACGEVNRDNFTLRLVGRYVENMRPALTVAGVEDLAEISGSVSHEQALALQRASTALLFFSWTNELGRHWHSAKVYEYIGAERPILVIGDRGAAASLVRKTDAGEITNDTQEVVAILLRWLAEFRATGQVATKSSPAQRRRLEWRPAVMRLAEVLDDVQEVPQETGR